MAESYIPYRETEVITLTPEAAQKILNEKDKIILEKEAQLAKTMDEYYTFDLSVLKVDLLRDLGTRRDETQETRDDQLRDIALSMKRLIQLGQEHLAKGSNYQIDTLDENTIIQKFTEYSELYEKIVRDSN